MVKKTSANGKPVRGPGRIRGLSRAEYLTTARMVRKGLTSWDELERKGLVLPAARESEFRKHVKRTLAKKS